MDGRLPSLFPTFINEPSALIPFDRPDTRPPTPFFMMTTTQGLTRWPLR